MDKKSAYLLIGLLVFLNLSLVYRYKIKGRGDELPNANESELKIALLNEIIVARGLIDGTIIDPSFELMKEDGRTITFCELVEDTAKIVVWFSEISCQSCVDSLLSVVIPFAKKNKIQDKLICIADYDNKQYLKEYKRLNQIHIPFYSPKKKELFIPIENIVPPYLFVVERDFKVQHLFLPEKMFLSTELGVFLKTYIFRYIN